MLIVDDNFKKRLYEQTELLEKPYELKAIAKVTHPLIDWVWYLICFKSEYHDNEIYSIWDGMVTELGFVGLEEINSYRIKGIPFGIDETFIECNAFRLYKKIKNEKKEKKNDLSYC